MYKSLWPLVLCLTVLLRVAGAAEPETALSEADKLMAVRCDAAVIARVGMLSGIPETGFAALWIEYALKGRLQAGQHIIWVPRKELPKAEVNATLWLLFLRQDGDGSFHVLHEGEEGPLVVANSAAPEVRRAAKFLGVYAPPPLPEPLCAPEITDLLKHAARGSQERRRESTLKLLANPDSIRKELESASVLEDDRQLSALGKTLLPLTTGGPVVNGLRLNLQPAAVELKPDQIRVLSVNFSNLTDAPVRLVTGASTWGDNIDSASAWDVRSIVQKEISDTPASPKTAAPLPTVLPAGFGVAKKDDGAVLPLVRDSAAFGMLTLPVELRLESVKVGDKEVLRLKFPQGHVDLPGAGFYSLQVHFQCPGPRPDQKRLIDAQYWTGGRLSSNVILLKIP